MGYDKIINGEFTSKEEFEIIANRVIIDSANNKYNNIKMEIDQIESKIEKNKINNISLNKQKDNYILELNNIKVNISPLDKIRKQTEMRLNNKKKNSYYSYEEKIINEKKSEKQKEIDKLEKQIECNIIKMNKLKENKESLNIDLTEIIKYNEFLLN